MERAFDQFFFRFLSVSSSLFNRFSFLLPLSLSLFLRRDALDTGPAGEGSACLHGQQQGSSGDDEEECRSSSVFSVFFVFVLRDGDDGDDEDNDDECSSLRCVVGTYSFTLFASCGFLSKQEERLCFPVYFCAQSRRARVSKAPFFEEGKRKEANSFFFFLDLDPPPPNFPSLLLLLTFFLFFFAHGRKETGRSHGSHGPSNETNRTGKTKKTAPSRRLAVVAAAASSDSSSSSSAPAPTPTELIYSRLQNGSDIRGVAIAGVEGQPLTLSPAVAFFIGKGLVEYLRQRKKKKGEDGGGENDKASPFPRIAVGRDPRLSGPMLEGALAAGVAAAGGQVARCGLATTPAMFLACVAEGHEYDGAEFF